MATLSVFLILWLVVGLTAGEMLIDCALTTIEESGWDDNTAAVLIVFSIACLIGLPWLIVEACADFIRR